MDVHGRVAAEALGKGQNDCVQVEDLLFLADYVVSDLTVQEELWVEHLRFESKNVFYAIWINTQDTDSDFW